MSLDLKSADEKATKVVEILAPFCARIEIAGRRWTGATVGTGAVLDEPSVWPGHGQVGPQGIRGEPARGAGGVPGPGTDRRCVVA
jgi:hypothetical protein